MYTANFRAFPIFLVITGKTCFSAASNTFNLSLANHWHFKIYTSPSASSFPNLFYFICFKFLSSRNSLVVFSDQNKTDLGLFKPEPLRNESLSLLLWSQSQSLFMKRYRLYFTNASLWKEISRQFKGKLLNEEVLFIDAIFLPKSNLGFLSSPTLEWLVICVSHYLAQWSSVALDRQMCGFTDFPSTLNRKV